MKDLKILFLRRYAANLVGAPSAQHQFDQEAARFAECAYAGEGFPDYRAGESMEETVKRVMPDADWVIDREDNYHVLKPKSRRYRVGVFISDLHAKYSYRIDNPVGFASLVNDAGYDSVFMRYLLLYGTHYRPEVVYDHLKGKACWVPWSVDENLFKPAEESRYDVSFLGSTFDCYPMRRRVWDDLYYVARGFSVMRKAAPTGGTYERTCESLRDRFIVGEDYARVLGETRILIFDCSIYRYPVLKFFEGAASGCLLMSNPPGMGSHLGFVDGETMVEVNEGNWEEVLRLHLEHPELGEEIALNALDLVRTRHTHGIRAEQWVDYLAENSEGAEMEVTQ